MFALGGLKRASYKNRAKAAAATPPSTAAVEMTASNGVAAGDGRRPLPGYCGSGLPLLFPPAGTAGGGGGGGGGGGCTPGADVVVGAAGPTGVGPKGALAAS